MTDTQKSANSKTASDKKRERFTDEERAKIRETGHAAPISLGPRILRAETAALASLAAYMAVAGDWR